MTTVYVLLEGPDDERFFDSVLRPELAKTYGTIRTYRYAQRSRKDIEKYVKPIQSAKQDYSDVKKSLQSVLQGGPF